MSPIQPHNTANFRVFDPPTSGPYGRPFFLGCLKDPLDLVDGCSESYGEEKGE